ncbi:dTDP-4-dehydrorhamnose reductase [Fulvimarina sp. 2208YS6-2-32]|uniref:dTDP-4-dehydrorhamnose reductase n=1 Tax=Fulvimarina uroteuthidis TaxID=3098149 RepID=A0ABU5I0M9_9HYPH|nr:dTDP-4-dehydrorhamnose reductase [Fulvimarina sp. 2208YS6-2-32]MDY8108875.1 dTDP-4-dehydrorhamnose reductase [Fulvimarina sp. 2208YS6-2-32]
MRMLVTGREGQVVTALRERAERAGIEIVTLGRPDLDLTASPEAVTAAVVKASAGVSVIVSAAAYTAVDKAEAEPDVAMAANGRGAGAVARAAVDLGVPVIHLSTDYVFDGEKNGAWLETDATNPIGVYGRSKLAGEDAVRAAGPRHVILRTAWVYSPFGQNFVKTMLRLAAAGRDSLNVVADQTGSPTSALDIADAILTIAATLEAEPGDEALYGTFHLAGTGQTNWADFARAIFEGARARGSVGADVVSIPTSQYPTPAARPKNSVLSTTRLSERHHVKLPSWQTSLATVLDRLIEAPSRADGKK